MPSITGAVIFKRWKRFLRRLQEQVATPSEANPTVRCWKRTVLVALISDLVDKDRTELKSTFPTAHEIISHLESIGWLHPIKIQKAKTVQDFYLMDMEAAETESIDPLELLQAHLPTGVISYFGALSFYELTTQVPPFFHIGRLLSSQPPPVDRGQTARPSTKRNPLGVELFTFADAVCYETKRFRALTPGIQLRTVGPRTWLRITTLEQTLIDTLIQPTRCGGEAVVLEAWDRGLRSYDPERMASHLAAIGRDDLWRRIGAIHAIMDVDVLTKTPLAPPLLAVRQRLTPRSEAIQLLPGLSFRTVNKMWRVRVR